MFHMSSGAVRETNPKCTFKTEIANDRAEPTIAVQLGQLITAAGSSSVSWSLQQGAARSVGHCSREQHGAGSEVN